MIEVEKPPYSPKVPQSKLDEMNALLLWGTFAYEGDRLNWYYSMEFTCEEPHDHLWDVYTDAARIAREHLPDYEITDNWADNDSAGFDLLPKFQ